MIWEEDVEPSGEIRVEAPPPALAAPEAAAEAPSAVEPVAPPLPPTPEELLAAQFKGKKADLKPLYDAVVHIARRLHPKVRVEPTPNAVRFVARRPFAVFKATTAERIDLGLSLGELEPRGRLRACKALAGVEGITHRIELFGPSDLNAELVRYMKLALEAPPPKPKEAAPAKAAQSGPAGASAKPRPQHADGGIEVGMPPGEAKAIRAAARTKSAPAGAPIESRPKEPSRGSAPRITSAPPAPSTPQRAPRAPRRAPAPSSAKG